MAKGLDVLGDEVIRMFVEHVTPGLVAEIERAVNEVRREAEARWPVGKRWRGDTRPHSRDLFATRVELVRKGNDYEVVGRLTNGADWLVYIRPLKLGKSAVVEWIRKPMAAQRDRIRAALPKVVARG